jgi:uncharacterized membrane protein HdeD (DUF308 family)
MKVLGIIMGVLLIIGGIYCMLTPVLTFTSLGWLVGFSMLFEGIVSILSWNKRRAIGLADGWSLAGAIISTVLAVFVLISIPMQLGIDLMLAYLAAFWLIVAGVTRTMSAFTLKRLHERDASVGGGWGWVLAAGILLIITGAICLLHPVLTMASVGMLLGIGIVSSGCGLIMGAMSGRVD